MIEERDEEQNDRTPRRVRTRGTPSSPIGRRIFFLPKAKRESPFANAIAEAAKAPVRGIWYEDLPRPLSPPRRALKP